MKPKVAKAFLESSTRVRGHFGCRNTHCCPSGVKDQLENPTRHYIHTRSEQISKMAEVPANIRINHYLDDHVRPISDDVAAVGRLPSLNSEIKKAIAKKQKTVGRFRQAMAHLAKTHKLHEPAAAPLSRNRERAKNDSAGK